LPSPSLISSSYAGLIPSARFEDEYECDDHQDGADGDKHPDPQRDGRFSRRFCGRRRRRLGLEAEGGGPVARPDCFVAALLAMTISATIKMRHIAIVSIHTYVLLSASCAMYLYCRENIQIGRIAAANCIHNVWIALFRVAWRRSHGESNRHA